MSKRNNRLSARRLNGTPFPHGSAILLFGLAAFPLSAANVDTYWKNTGTVENPNPNGEWTDAANWTNGLPSSLSPTDGSRAIFDITSGAVSNVTVADGSGIAFNGFSILGGKTLNLALGSNTTFSTGSLQVGSLNTATHLKITGPATGTSAVDLGSFINIGSGPTGTANSVTLSGSGLNASASGTTTVGRTGNSNTMIVEDGASFTGTAVVVSGTQNVTSGVGNNHQFIVRGAGTDVTFTGGGALGLVVGARPLTGSSSSNVQQGNRILVQDGGRLALTVDSSASLAEVLVGAATYRVNNWIDVSGAGSVLEVSGNARTRIGAANAITDTSYNNRITVSNGGTFLTDAEIQINQGPSTAASRRNILSIDNGGTLATNNVVNNNGGLVRLASGGQIVAETLAGAPATAIVNINGTGRFEGAGLIGEGVTVNVGNGGLATFGFGSANGYTDVGTVDLQGTVNFNEGTTVAFMIKSATEIDQINIGATGLVNIDPTASLSIFSAYAFKTGDTFQLFTGNLAGITGSFADELVTMPTLSGGLSWDLSEFTAEHGYTLTVVPEPSLVALALGAGAFGFVALRRRQRKAA